VVTRRTPLGVVGAITPWNFPVLLSIWKIAPALVAGNTIIVKPSPFTPLCLLKLAELAQAFLPPGVFNVVPGGDDLGKWMTAHPGIDKIAFTGHTETGKHVMRSAAGTLKRLTLELGGHKESGLGCENALDGLAEYTNWKTLTLNKKAAF